MRCVIIFDYVTDFESRKLVNTSQLAYQAGAYPGICSMK